MSWGQLFFGSRRASGPRVRFWGVRGSIACAGPQYAVYGGNTSCVEVRCGDAVIIIDAGTGLRALGDALSVDSHRDLHILLSHTHFDHVCGLPFFKPAYDPKVTLTLWSGHSAAAGSGQNTRAIMERLMEAPLFPVDPHVFRAKLIYRDFTPGAQIEPVAGLVAKTEALNHPNGATAFRVESGGQSVVYASDHEHGQAAAEQRLSSFCRGADLVIYDATYTDASYGDHRGWGHSTWQAGLALAVRAGVKSLALFHHDPSHTDKVMAQIEREAAKAGQAAGVKVFAAREGMVWPH